MNPGSAQPMTLTRRGRLAFLGLPIIVGLIVAVLGFSLLLSSWVNQAQANVEPASGVDSVSVQVTSGDTLWSIASETRSDVHPQAVMQEITEFNDLNSSTLQPGQTIEVPLSN